MRDDLTDLTPRDRHLLRRAEDIGDYDHILMWHAGSETLCGWDADCLNESYLDDFLDPDLTEGWTPREGITTLEEHIEDWHDWLTVDADAVFPQHVERYVEDDGPLDERCDRCGATARYRLTQHLAKRKAKTDYRSLLARLNESLAVR